MSRLFPGRFDEQLAAGVTPDGGSALAVHAARLTSVDEREQLARSLRRMRTDARLLRWRMSARVPIHRAGIESAAELIDELTLRLHASRPVRARGMARLRQLLSEGAGPVYGPGRGDLRAALRGVLATL